MPPPFMQDFFCTGCVTATCRSPAGGTCHGYCDTSSAVGTVSAGTCLATTIPAILLVGRFTVLFSCRYISVSAPITDACTAVGLTVQWVQAWVPFTLPLGVQVFCKHQHCHRLPTCRYLPAVEVPHGAVQIQEDCLFLQCTTTACTAPYHSPLPFRYRYSLPLPFLPFCRYLLCLPLHLSGVTTSATVYRLPILQEHRLQIPLPFCRFVTGIILLTCKHVSCKFTCRYSLPLPGCHARTLHLGLPARLCLV